MGNNDLNYEQFIAFVNLSELVPERVFSMIQHSKLGNSAFNYIPVEYKQQLDKQALAQINLACEWIDSNFYKKSYDC